MTSATTTASQMLRPCCQSVAITMPERLDMAPVEMSISPVKITSASPRAISPMKRNPSHRAKYPRSAQLPEVRDS